MIQLTSQNKFNCLMIGGFILSIALNLPNILRENTENQLLKNKAQAIKYQQLSDSIDRDAVIDRVSEATCRIALQAERPNRYARARASLKANAIDGTYICFYGGEIGRVKRGQIELVASIGSRKMKEISTHVYEGSIEIKGAN
jgi:hypothetical protein